MQGLGHRARVVKVTESFARENYGLWVNRVWNPFRKLNNRMKIRRNFTCNLNNDDGFSGPPSDWGPRARALGALMKKTDQFHVEPRSPHCYSHGLYISDLEREP
ncbi:hypothetical protein EVAR_78688_1 [Eumeta japonica]|uniref:Uncharacterized protein n=1 Tax=Eumeta variegata TaxID=151549 RepID=A0A4C1U8S8_EUMVA|nr:hypothetical protein EVAR_78688_1 [Eumeta japonica]